MKALLPALLLSLAAAASAAEIPPLKARVTDLTGTLSAQQRDALEQTLAEFETRKGAQIAVLMLPSTQPETVEEYAVRVEEAWKLGRKGIDDSVLLVVAKNDRRLHIEVGYGLEGALPDAIAKRIIDDDITPRFRQGDFYGGIRAGVDSIMRVVAGEPLPPAAAHGTARSPGIDPGMLVFLFFLVVVAGGALRAVLGRVPGASVGAGIAGFAGWLLLGSAALALVVGVVAFFAMLLGGFTGGTRRSGWGGPYGGWGGPWGGMGGGGFGGGGFGGGGFSGGGGGSGGGGASGSW